MKLLLIVIPVIVLVNISYSQTGDLKAQNCWVYFTKDYVKLIDYKENNSSETKIKGDIYIPKANIHATQIILESGVYIIQLIMLRTDSFYNINFPSARERDDAFQKIFPGVIVHH